jgi:hypothetical protein
LPFIGTKSPSISFTVTASGAVVDEGTNFFFTGQPGFVDLLFLSVVHPSGTDEGGILWADLLAQLSGNPMTIQVRAQLSDPNPPSFPADVTVTYRLLDVEGNVLSSAGPKSGTAGTSSGTILTTLSINRETGDGSFS